MTDDEIQARLLTSAANGLRDPATCRAHWDMDWRSILTPLGMRQAAEDLKARADLLRTKADNIEWLADRLCDAALARLPLESAQ